MSADRRLLYKVEPRKLCRYWTKVHQIFTRCIEIIVAIKARIGLATFQFVMERQRKEWRWYQSSVFLVQKLIEYYSNVPWASAKRMLDLSSPPTDLPILKFSWSSLEYFLISCGICHFLPVVPKVTISTLVISEVTFCWNEFHQI